MAIDIHKPYETKDRNTLLFAASDTPGFLIIGGLHGLFALFIVVRWMVFNKGCWALDPIPWWHGAPMHMPLGRSPLTYYACMSCVFFTVFIAWGSSVSRSTWPDRPWPVICMVLAAILLVLHGAVAVSMW